MNADRRRARPSSALQALCASALIVLAVGCGFKLRGPAELPAKTVRVTGYAFEPVVHALTQRLRESPTVTLVDRIEAAGLVIHIVSAERDDDILSVGRSGHVLQYEYSLVVKYRVCGPGGQSCLDDATIELRRAMTYDESQILAKQNEQRFLERDMAERAAQLILQSVSHYRRPEPPPTAKPDETAETGGPDDPETTVEADAGAAAP